VNFDFPEPTSGQLRVPHLGLGRLLARDEPIAAGAPESARRRLWLELKAIVPGTTASLPAESYFGLQVALLMGLSQQPGPLDYVPRQADHLRSFQGGNDESRYFLRIHASLDLSALDSAIDDRTKTIAPFI
jgi:hypothetical protein